MIAVPAQIDTYDAIAPYGVQNWTRESLIAFEQDIIETFERGEIKAPVHLAGGNEDELIEIFRAIRADDWVLTSWRSHYHCLLKGVPSAQVKDAILRGRSIGLCFPQHRILSSAIVGGIAPIAVGLAWEIKQRGGSEHVYVFLGDMTAETGIVHEAAKYARGHKLPVEFILEHNGLSVCTDTEVAWGASDAPFDRYYPYTLTRPHVGTGKFVSF